MTRLTVNDLRFAYGDQAVLMDLCLDAEVGEVVGVLGPNGCGKTTLFKIITGLLSPTKGTIFIDGADISDLDSRSRAQLVATVPQEPLTPVGFTVAEVVLMGRNPHLSLLEFEHPNDRQIATTVMELTDILHLAHRSLFSLSGGERQRVIVALALVQQTPVLLLDEPTSNLDLYAQTKVMSLVQNVCRAQGATILVAMHDLTLAAQWCDRVVLMADGNSRMQGLPDRVLTEQNVADAYGIDVVVTSNPESRTPVVLPMSKRSSK
jgi:iron complex transport system ATP-binding protein